MSLQSRSIESVGYHLVSEEAGQADYGDLRLSRRGADITSRLAKSPSLSFPQAMNNLAETEGFYRFITNPKVTASKTLCGHFDQTTSAVSDKDRVLVIHDDTSVGLNRTEETAQDLFKLTNGRYGFGLHASLVIGDSQEREILGMGETQFFDPNFKPDTETRAEHYQHPENNRRRWRKGIKNVEQRLESTQSKVVHVADREADIFELLNWCHQQDTDCVIRSQYDRGLNWPEHADELEKGTNLKEALSNQAPIAERTIQLSKRNEQVKGLPSDFGNHSNRQTRHAHVDIYAQKVPLARPTTIGLQTETERLWVNAVRVLESAPNKNEDCIDWIILTTLPIDTVDKVLDVIDIYRLRWVIEEYFKCLKTGCRLEERQVESQQTLRNVTALLIPIACQMLFLRYLSRKDSTRKAAKALCPSMFQALKLKCDMKQIKHASDPDLNQAYAAIARLGGHLPQNGPPGWQVLWRGMREVIETKQILEATKQRDDILEKM